MIRRVIGNSMRPGILPGAIVIAAKKNPRVGDIVIARQASREVVKRLAHIDGRNYILRGDNTEESVDSREFGPVKKSDILGVVMITLPLAVAPPKPRTPYAAIVGMGAAGVLVLMALIHLFRIDTFIPLLDTALPGGMTFAAFVGASLMTMEVFAVPFMLRMKLSPLAHAVGGILSLFVPLVWVLISIWNYGYAQSTAELGEFAATPSNWLLVGVNLVWLGYNFWALWLLRYDKIFEALSKRR